MGKTLSLAFLIILFGFMIGCTKKTNDSQKQADQTATTVPHAVAGIHWTVPQGWISLPERPMRAATYKVPSSDEKTEAGECGVFYFGTGQGGNVEDNLKRWISQFDKGGQHEFSSKEVNGLKVTIIQITGTYITSSGPMMESGEKKDNYMLLGAIAEGPQGSVFFKFTGPLSTVTSKETEFTQLVNSLAKD
jgi:hypothetical protein